MRREGPAWAGMPTAMAMAPRKGSRWEERGGREMGGVGLAPGGF